MKNHPTFARSLFVPVVVLVTVGAVGCAKVSQTGGAGASTGTGGTGVNGGTGGSFVPGCTACADFPPDPIIDTGVTGNPGSMFGGAASGTGPCITEPQDDTLFPNNWLRPRVKFSGANGKLVQIQMKAPNQTNPLIVYTMNDSWIMPAGIWGAIRVHQVVDYVTVTVRIQGGGESSVRFRTAPVPAGGSLVFWAAKPTEVDKNLNSDCAVVNNQPVPSCYQNDSELRGFKVGDETTASVLTIGQVQQKSKDNNNNTSSVRCIGCHAGAPGGDYVSFNDAWPWRAVVAGVTATNVGMTPPYVTQGGVETMWQPALGVTTFSPAHWSDGPPSDRIVITSYSLTSPKQNDWYNANRNARPNLAWFDLASPPVPLVNGNGNFTGDIANPQQVFPIDQVNMGIIARTGDPRGGTTPNWSHDGKTIVYTSTDAALDGRLDNQPVPNPNPNNEVHNQGHADLWTVPYNNRAGGAAAAVTGADTSMYEEYFPSYSPDDKLIAFNRVPASQPMYANANSEIAVIKTSGGTAWRLNANTPPMCTNKVSPGVNNHWAKWSPGFAAGVEGTYYWVVFSSNRTDIPPVTSNFGPKRQIQISQLYIAPVIVTETGITSYPAIYLWNQPTTTVNTTPAWEMFQLPPIL